MVTLKSNTEIATMREAGRIVAEVLQRTAEQARPGVRLAELDTMAADLISTRGAKPSFLGYKPWWARTPYPGVLCLSVNDAIVHAIPDDRRLQPGDLLSIDLAVYVDGLHADAAITVPIGAVDDQATRLCDTTRAALDAGLAQVHDGQRLGDVAHAIETVARSAGYGLPDGYGGHGIGTAMHEDPSVPNEGRPGRGMRLRPGLVIAIEPMLIESGSNGHRTLADGWTVATVDGSRAAHFEHTVAVTDEGPVILTLR
jgi:methionyl aminopeptidase